MVPRKQESTFPYLRTDHWKKHVARNTVSDLKFAIKEFCKICNGETVWNENNDCINSDCPMFPYRPGTQNPEVKGVRRAAPSKRGYATTLQKP